MVTGQPTSCQAPSPKHLFLPDETLDLLNTSDARHLIVLLGAVSNSKMDALLGRGEEVEL